MIRWLRLIAGALIAPIVPGLVVAGIYLGAGNPLDAKDVMTANVVVGYPFAIAVGGLAHLMLQRFGQTMWWAYLIAGAGLGASFYLIGPSFMEALMRLEGLDGAQIDFSIVVLPAAMAIGSVMAIAFWLIARPDQTSGSLRLS